jgi:hypothetical protein
MARRINWIFQEQICDEEAHQWLALSIRADLKLSAASCGELQIIVVAKGGLFVFYSRVRPVKLSPKNMCWSLATPTS